MKQKKLRKYLRAVIQLGFFITMPSAFTAAFAGVKSVFTLIGAGESIGWSAFLRVLVALCIYTMIFGRFFCGFACAFGSLGDAVYGAYRKLCKKLKKKPKALKKEWHGAFLYIKYVILGLIIILCYMDVYKKLQGSSPWDVFSMLHAGNLRLGGYIAGAVILVLILVGMALKERFFCLYLCPMGAIFSLLPVLPFMALYRNRENCINRCKGCTNQCPSAIELPEGITAPAAGECFMCQKCIDICPKSNVHCGISMKLKGNEIVLTIMKTAILAGLMIWLNI